MSIAVAGRKSAPKKLAADERPAGWRHDGNGSGAAIEGQSILLVEDEALVAMMMKEFLREIGFQVVGPFGKVADAIEAIELERPHAAILDINLGGEMIYPLADELSARGVPIVFVTGYGAEAIDRRFANVPVLQKPVDNATLQRVLDAAKNIELDREPARSASVATG
jgi:two-component SAPR family response regulator